MSFNLRNIREISNDPLSKFTDQLSRKISKFITSQQQDNLENKEDIYSDGQDVDSVLKFHSLNSTKTFNFDTIYYPPTEPDLNKLKLWIKGDNIGNTVNDISGYSNTGELFGDPMLLDGTPFDYGIHTAGTKSICLRLNRPTSGLENQEYIEVPDDAMLQVSGIATGISIFIRFRLGSIANQGSKRRTLYTKLDDTTPNNLICITVSDIGELGFWVKRAGTDYLKKTAASTIAADTVYECWFTYAVSGNTQHIYVNNVDKTLSADITQTLPDSLTNYDAHIFWRGRTDGGHTYGDLYDIELFREKVVSAAEVGYHYTNKWTIANIPFGQVMVNNYWATYYTLGAGFTTTGYTTVGYDT